jgi:hypothetical protein
VSSRAEDGGHLTGAPSPGLAAARRLISRIKSYPASVESPDPSVTALQRSCTIVVQNVRQALGDHGCEALMSRAIATIEPRHPLVTELRHGQTFTRERLATAVQMHGAAAAEAAVESLIGTLIEILARLIGEEMAIRMVDPDGPPHVRDGARTS